MKSIKFTVWGKSLMTANAADSMVKTMENTEEFEDIYEDVVIENYNIPVVITDVLVRKHKNTGRKIYLNHPDSIHKIEKGLKSTLDVTPRYHISYKR